MTPSEKSPEIESFLEKSFGRTTSIEGNKCVFCGGDATHFKDALSRREYAISGLCQKCQDQTFGE